MNKIDKLKKIKSSLIEEMGNIEIRLYAIDKEIEELKEKNKKSNDIIEKLKQELLDKKNNDINNMYVSRK